MIEYVLIASIIAGFSNHFHALYPASKYKPAPLHTTGASNSSRTLIQHTTSTDGDGTNPVYNVSFINNNAPESPKETAESTQNYLKKTLDSINVNSITDTAYQYCSDNKYYIAALFMAGSYGYSFYKVRTIQGYVDNALTWSAWKKDVSFDALLTIPHDQLTRDLMMVIQTRYVSPQNPADFLTPLITFSKEITQELELVKSYHNYITWCTQFRLQKILPISDLLLTQLTERKQRVLYIHTLFQSWLAQYKLEQMKP